MAKGFVKLECAVHGKTWHFNLIKDCLPTEDCQKCHPLVEKPELKEVKSQETKSNRPELTKAQIKKLEKKWSEKFPGAQAHIFSCDHPGSPLPNPFADVPKDEGLKENEFFCSFCGAITDRSRATFGTGFLRIRSVRVTVSLSPLVTRKQMKVTAQKLVACPNCCLEIKPRVVDGVAVHSNIRTYDEG